MFCDKYYLCLFFRVDVNLKDYTNSQGKGLGDETYKVKHETSSAFTSPVTRRTPSVVKTARSMEPDWDSNLQSTALKVSMPPLHHQCDQSVKIPCTGTYVPVYIKINIKCISSFITRLKESPLNFLTSCLFC
jgi:hypothetical protein